MASEDTKFIVLITGAATGLGFETAKALFSRPEPYHILIGFRGDVSRALDAIAKLKQFEPHSLSTADPLCIDIASDESISDALNHVKRTFGYIDVLVNNAGADMEAAFSSGRLTERESWNSAWDVNVTGTHLVTSAFAPLLMASKSPNPRLLFITSGLSSVGDHAGGVSHKYGLPPAGWPKQEHAPYFLSYRCSKTGMNMLATEWARLLRNDGVKVFNVSPGFLNTRLGLDRETGHAKDLGAMGAGDPSLGGDACADAACGKMDDLAWPPRVLRKGTTQPW